MNCVSQSCNQGRVQCPTPDECDSALVTPADAGDWLEAAIVVAVCVLALLAAVSPALI